MYIVACTLENSTIAYRLHAIDITTGSEPYGPGVLITGSYGGIMLGALSGATHVAGACQATKSSSGFPAQQVEMPLNYVGWVMAYGETTLQQTGVFAHGGQWQLQGGVWHPAVRRRSTVRVTSTCSRVIRLGGGFNGVTDFSESALKLDPANGLRSWIISRSATGNTSTIRISISPVPGRC